ncbi:DoxX family membrane protein [Gemmatimonadota bacterium]
MEGNAILDRMGGADYTNMQATALVLLRIFIGWHLLYEGLVKAFNPYWTSGPYLAESKWIFKGIFTWMADHQTILTIVDFLNQWGLIIIGLCLILGLFSRPMALAGMVLLLAYYLANPPFLAYKYTMPPEGSYIIVNKNLIEATALLVLALFPTGGIVGLDRLMALKKST